MTNPDAPTPPVSANSAKSKPEGPFPTSPWLTFWIASVAIFTVTLDTTAIIVAFPALRQAFHGEALSTLSWTLNAYTIAYAALLVPAGRWADLAGRKRAFFAGLGLFSLASLGCALSDGIYWLIAARAVQAAGAAILTPSGLALVLATFPKEARGGIVGLFGAVGALAAAVGPSFGSWLIAIAGWHWIFLINLPIGLITAWLGARRLKENSSPETGAPFDLLGTLMLAAGSAALTYSVVLLHDSALASTLVFVCLGSVLLGGFWWWAKDRPQAAMDIGLFKDQSFLWVNIATLSFGIAFSMMFLSGFLFLTQIWQYPQAQAGLAVTPGPLTVVMTAIVASRFVARLGFTKMIFIGAMVFSLGQCLYALRVSPTADYLWIWLPAQLVTGMGIGMVFPGLGAGSVSALSARNFAMGSGINNALRQFGGAIGAALAVTLVGQTGVAFQEFQKTFSIIAGFGFLTAFLSILSRKKVSN